MKPHALAIVALVACASPAYAQKHPWSDASEPSTPATPSSVHWDLSVQIGAQKRFLTDRQGAMNDAGVGPEIMTSLHLGGRVVRVGPYVGFESSPIVGDAPGRYLLAGGLQLKLLSPTPLGPLHFYFMTGFGAVYAMQREGNVPDPSDLFDPNNRQPRLLNSDDGNFLEVPFGVGAFWGNWDHWNFVAELVGRVGFRHEGVIYKTGSSFSGATELDPANEDRYPPYGDDRWAVGLTIGVIYDK